MYLWTALNALSLPTHIDIYPQTHLFTRTHNTNESTHLYILLPKHMYPVQIVVIGSFLIRNIVQVYEYISIALHE